MKVKENMIDGLKASNSQKSVEIKKLKCELLEQNQRIKHVFEEVVLGKRERNRALEQAKSDRHAAQCLKAELEDERAALKKLQEENAQAALVAECQRESLLTEIRALQDHLVHLDSEAHRVEIMEDYRHSALGKVEVALACKAGFDYHEAWLSAEMKSVPNHFNYPPRVANCLEVLLAIEEQGGGFELGGRSRAEDEELDDEADEGSAEEAGEAGEGSVKQVGEVLAQDSWVSTPEKKNGGGAEPDV